MIKNILAFIGIVAIGVVIVAIFYLINCEKLYEKGDEYNG